jgi:hypothetical protein
VERFLVTKDGHPVAAPRSLVRLGEGRGDDVIIDGPLVGLQQYITGMDKRRCKVALEFLLLGRTVAVTLGFIQEGERQWTEVAKASKERAEAHSRYLKEYAEELAGCSGLYTKGRWRGLEREIVGYLADRPARGRDIESLLNAFAGFAVNNKWVFYRNENHFELFVARNSYNEGRIGKDEFREMCDTLRMKLCCAAVFVQRLVERGYFESETVLNKSFALPGNITKDYRRYSDFFNMENSSFAAVYGKRFFATGALRKLMSNERLAMSN